MAEPVRIAVIGGSGLYNMPELTDVEERRVDTPFGAPSDAVLVGTLAGQRVAFLPRHGRGHVLTPTEVPYRANIFALKSLGVEQIVSVSACGSLREDFAPGHVVIPDQLIDLTRGLRTTSFFEQGLVAHVSVADPFCNDLGGVLADAVEAAGGVAHRGATYVTVEGPRFSTRAESALYRRWGAGIIGMTTAPEAFLAREAEMCYAVMAHVTDYDVWHATEDDVSVELVIQTLNANLRLAQRALVGVIERVASRMPDCGCAHALDGSLITDPARVPDVTLDRLWPIVGKYFERT
ncbi:S-methyl-5'-thioadenosine phosphorylase [Aggregatilinea lenta]|uniref:S-methyl-5'-thioadenosine phosphorylase n=1 Tax=Aggregatilinea lenta TaxID=913108 RepID=UPI001EE90AA7|nr:S-methyl-5'-thioadenosine phosphorylase [Aggregatilinea lenta]